MKKWIKEVLLTTCVSYTLLSIVIGFINSSTADAWDFYKNLVMMLLWTLIAVSVLYSHTLFEKWPPVIVILVQYVISLSLVMLIIWISSFFTTLHPKWFRDVLISFTIPYIIGASAFYIETFHAVRKANTLLQAIHLEKGGEEP